MLSGPAPISSEPFSLYVSADNIIGDADDFFIASFSANTPLAVAAGSSVITTVNAGLPIGLDPGFYHFIVHFDALSGETNTAVVLGEQMIERGYPLADLVHSVVASLGCVRAIAPATISEKERVSSNVERRSIGTST